VKKRDANQGGSLTNASSTWSNPNDLKQNTMAESEILPFRANLLFEAELLDEEKIIKERIKKASREELKQTEQIIKEQQQELKTDENYQKYVEAYTQYYKNMKYLPIDQLTKNNELMTAAMWKAREETILKKISEFGTYDNQIKIKENKATEKLVKEASKKPFFFEYIA